MIDGITIRLGEREFVVPSLTFAQVRRFQADGTLDKVPALGAVCLAHPETMTAAEAVLFAALSRNYPDLKREELADLLDLSSVEAAVDAVMGATGLKRRIAQQGEAQRP